MADRNEMNIPLIEGFRLRADDDNWIIEEEAGKDGKLIMVPSHKGTPYKIKIF